MSNNIDEVKNNFAIPVAIVVAGMLIAGAIYIGQRGDNFGGTKPQVVEETDSSSNIAPITEADHVRGNPNAKVKIVEYSDFECPFCKQFHGTMNKVMDEYGESGQVAWVLRQFPLDSLHPVKARAEAIATECASEIGGNDIFWSFADRLFDLTLSNNRTDIDIVIPQIVRELGINEQDFSDCVSSGKYDEHIESDIQNAIDTGGTGTPWSIVIAENGKTFPLSGAQPYSVVKQLIEIALQEK